MLVKKIDAGTARVTCRRDLVARKSATNCDVDRLVYLTIQSGQISFFRQFEKLFARLHIATDSFIKQLI
jgi:hypothetical protein